MCRLKFKWPATPKISYFIAKFQLGLPARTKLNRNSTELFTHRVPTRRSFHFVEHPFGMHLCPDNTNGRAGDCSNYEYTGPGATRGNKTEHRQLACVRRCCYRSIAFGSRDGLRWLPNLNFTWPSCKAWCDSLRSLNHALTTEQLFRREKIQTPKSKLRTQRKKGG